MFFGSAFQKLYSKVQLDTLCCNHYPFHKSLNRHCRKIISTPSSGLLKEYNYNGIKWDVDIPRTGEKGKLTLTLVVAYSQVKGKCMFWVYVVKGLVPMWSGRFREKRNANSMLWWGEEGSCEHFNPIWITVLNVFDLMECAYYNLPCVLDWLEWILCVSQNEMFGTHL